MLAISSPFTQFFDTDGTPLNNGQLYFGTANNNPESSPVTVYWDAAGTIPAAQPIRTLNGFPVRSGTPATVYADGNYSLLCKNRNGVQVFYARDSQQFSFSAAIAAVSAEVDDLRTDLASGTGGTGVGFLAGSRSLTKTVTQYNLGEVSLWSYMTDAEIAACRTGTSPANVTTAVKNAILDLLDRFAGGDIYPGGPGQPYDIQFTAIDRRTGVIKVPAGVYKVSPRVFDDITHPRKAFVGFHLAGEHEDSSVFMLETGGVESWFYANTDGAAGFQRWHFSRMGFTSDDYRYGSFFKVLSTGGPKQLNAFFCRFENLQKLLHTDGTGNADLSKFFGCRGLFYGDLLTLDNDQSVQHDFIGCDLGTYGNMVRVKTKGGGNVNFIGGSYDFVWHEDFSPVGGNFMFTHDSDANIAQGNATFCFQNLRVELEAYKRTAGAPPIGIVNTTAVPNLATPIVKFDSVNFVNGKTYTIDADGDIVSSEWRRVTAANLFPRKTVLFKNCVLLKNFFYNISGDRDASSPNAGAYLEFENCFDGISSELPSGDSALSNLHSRVTYSGSAGRVVTRNMNEDTTGSSFTRELLDADPNWRYAFAREPASLRKVTNIKHYSNGWPQPSTASNDFYVDIPPNMVALRVYINKPAEGSSTNSYRLHFGNEDKSVTFGSSTLAQFKDAHTIDLSHIELAGYTRLRCWATGAGSDFQNAGTAYIEHT